MSEVKPVPDGFRTVTPHLTVDGAEAAIAFYEEAFGARCVFNSPMPGTDKLGNAMLAMGERAAKAMADMAPPQ
jgi:PhnB protein